MTLRSTCLSNCPTVGIRGNQDQFTARWGSDCASTSGLYPTMIAPSDQGPSASSCYVEVVSDEEDDEVGDTNPDNYYTSAPASNLAEHVKLFLNTTFRRWIPKKRWLEMAKECPRPDMSATKVPRLDSDIKSALGRDQPDCKDENLSKVQASILASCAPLANFWSHLRDQGFEGKADEMIPASEVIKVMMDTTALIGNASSYISQTRRNIFIDSISGQHPNLAKFLWEICKGDLGDTGTELFGPQVRKKITDRADTIEAFNKAIAKVEAPYRVNAGQKQDTTESSCFLSKCPTAVYGGRSGRSYILYGRGSGQRARQNQFR